MKTKRLLLTTDLSQEALRPLAGLREMGLASNYETTLLHVVEIIAVAPPGGMVAPPIRPADVPAEEARAKKIMEEQAATLGRENVTTCVIHAGDVAGAICDYAKEHEFDLVALSSHGRTGFRRLVLGSVTELILRHASIPVLVFPRQDT